MTQIPKLLVFAAGIFYTHNAIAQEIYRDVDKKGVVEFSDHPSPGAKAVDVNPNVVDVVPAKSSKTSPPAGKPVVNAPRETNPSSVTEYRSSGWNSRRERLREQKARIDHAPAPIHRPGTGRAPIQGGGRRR